MQQTTARVTMTGALHEAMRPTQQRIMVSGKVRPGIKVLTQKAAQVKGAQEIYDLGVSDGRSFESIEAALKAVTGMPPYPLTPRNAPYFRVLQEDFKTPGAAQAIMDAYGEDRGEGRQLYSFPVVFPSDDISMIFREQFESWKATELFRWSENGQCMRRAEIKVDRSRRRHWGGRPVESCGPCRPNQCDLFANGQCHHVGSLYFWVPGVTGAGLIELNFTSIYASLGIVETLTFVQETIGSIKGTHRGRPIFRVSKTEENVSQIDWEAGKAKRQRQYIITLDASGIDMVEFVSGEAPIKIPLPSKAQDPITKPGASDVEPPQAAAETAIGTDPAQGDANPPVDTPPVNPEVVADQAKTPKNQDQSVRDLRRQLAAVMKEYDPPMAGDQLKSWLAANDMPETAVHDPEVLPAIIAVLRTERLEAMAAKAFDAASDETDPF